MCVTTKRSPSNQTKMSFHGFPTEGQTDIHGGEDKHTDTYTHAHIHTGRQCALEDLRWGLKRFTDYRGRYVLFNLVSRIGLDWMGIFSYAVKSRRITGGYILFNKNRLPYVGHLEATKLINQQKNSLCYWKCGHNAKGDNHRMSTISEIKNKPWFHCVAWISINSNIKEGLKKLWFVQG